MRGLYILFVYVVLVYGDCYLHNPRGSNDRLNENSADRQNANRVFDSENNARGGYSYAPDMTFYEGSQLMIEWTAQHGCGSDQVTCEFILQYMCSNPNSDAAATLIRDGTTTTTIPDDVNQFNQKDTTTGLYTYGMHESYQYYQTCKARERNKGLFTADQIVNGNSARFTRQNPNGNRYGFECTEERDYYPYWHPSPWKDIAVLADTTSRCDYYQKESQNVESKGYCNITPANNNEGSVPNNPAACVVAGGTWQTVGSWGLSAPACQQVAYSRDNHLGNGDNGQTARFNWTIPNEGCANQRCDCALRIRYNISNTNIDSWGFSDSTDNGKASPVTTNSVSTVEGTELQMALNTAQYGRTFQDRSFIFHIAKLPSGVSSKANIVNLNVRGKRGNIVQVFPATEYDFVPNDLVVTQGDYIHFQWTGADTNPQGNAGEGLAGTDRSNLVQIASLNENTPLTSTGNPLFESSSLRYQMAFVGQYNCPSLATLTAQGGDINQNPANCAKLNAAPAYYNGGLVRMNNSGTFTYMSTRNNNFSNRTQKGTITVVPKVLSPGAIAGIVLGCFFFVVISGLVGGFVYAKKRPNSRIGRLYAKLPSIKMPSFKKPSFSRERTQPLIH